MNPTETNGGQVSMERHRIRTMGGGSPPHVDVDVDIGVGVGVGVGCLRRNKRIIGGLALLMSASSNYLICESSV